MHLYILPRGIKHEVERFLSELSAKYYPMTITGKMKETMEKAMGRKVDGDKILVQLAIRPLVPYEIVFPEPCLKQVCQTIWPDEEYPKSQNIYVKWMKGIMRKIVGARELKEKEWEKGWGKPVYKQNVGVDLIGVKEDKKDEEGNEML